VRGMSSAPWDQYLADEDRQIIRNGRYGQTRGLGARPALLLIDLQHNYLGADEPISDQQDRWPAGGGRAAWDALRHVLPLLDACRAEQVPVIYTRNVQRQTTRFDSISGKAGWDHSMTIDGHVGAEIVDEVRPGEGELVVDKAYASAFYGTPLTSYLFGLRIDTVLLAGVSTSGCVRATAVDAAMLGLNVGVVVDAVADRLALSHAASLLDLWMKYADLVTSEQAAAYLRNDGRGDGSNRSLISAFDPTVDAPFGGQ